MTQAVLYQEHTSSRNERKTTTTTAPGDKGQPLHLTVRDYAVLEALYSNRYLTVPQLQALFWREHRGGQPEAATKACQRRMRLLTAHGVVRRIEPHIRYTEGKKPLIYALNKAGAGVLAKRLRIDPAEIPWQPSDAEENEWFMDHHLTTLDLWVDITQACEQTGVQLVSWLSEWELNLDEVYDTIVLVSPKGKRAKAAAKPDALFHLQSKKGTGLFFAELDLGSVTVAPSKWEQRGWARKTRTYLAYFSSQAYKQRYGDKLASVLTISTSTERLSHLKGATEKEGGGKRFWFSTFDQISPQTILTATIWQRAGADGQFSLLEG